MSLPLVFPTDRPLRRRLRQKLGGDVLFTGLIIGICALIGAALLLYVLNGNGRRWAAASEKQVEVLEEGTFRPEAGARVISKPRIEPVQRQNWVAQSR